MNRKADNTKAAVASADNTCLSTISWGEPRVDLFGVASDDRFWHKFYTGYDWQPFNTFEHLPSPENIAGCPSVTTWGDGRLDIFYTPQHEGNVLHKCEQLRIKITPSRFSATRLRRRVLRGIVFLFANRGYLEQTLVVAIGTPRGTRQKTSEAAILRLWSPRRGAMIGSISLG